MYRKFGYNLQQKLAMFVTAKYLTTLKPFSLLTFSDVCVCVFVRVVLPLVQIIFIFKIENLKYST